MEGGLKQTQRRIPSFRVVARPRPRPRLTGIRIEQAGLRFAALLHPASRVDAVSQPRCALFAVGVMEYQPGQRYAVLVVVIRAMQQVETGGLAADGDVRKARWMKLAVARVIDTGDFQFAVNAEGD